MAYMKQRRNESESCEFLIHFGFRFEKLNIQLQTGVYDAFKCLETIALNATPQPSTNICINVIYSPFESVNISVLD